jgi:CRISPR-associated protein Cmr4
MTHAGFLHFHCLTPLHNGAGQGLGSIDRPIVREVATRHPFVQSSTLKGALRAAAIACLRRQGRADPEEDPELLALFGKGETDGNLGAASLTDAAVLLFPVRSLAGTLAWATSPFALANFHRLRALAVGAGDPLLAAAGEVLDGVLLPASGTACGGVGGEGAGAWSDAEIRLAPAGDYVIEGLILRPLADPAARKRVGNLAALLASALFPPGFWQGFFRPRLLLLGNDDYTHLLLHATEIEANIKIGKSGVTEDGTLRYTEYLPAETVLFSFYQLLAPGRGVARTAVEKLLADAARELRQLGADESKGKGLVRTLIEAPVGTGRQEAPHA